jgi:hypothetical protein
MYKKLFKLSGLTNTQIQKALDIQYNQRAQFERSTKINFETFVMFGKKLGVTEVQMSKLVFDEIRDLCK